MIEKRKSETPEQREKRKRDRQLNDLRVILSTPEGRRFVWRVLAEGKMFVDGYVPGDQGYGTTRNAGRHLVGIWAMAEIMEAKPEAFMQMQRENASEATREEMHDKEVREKKDILTIDSQAQPMG